MGLENLLVANHIATFRDKVFSPSWRVDSFCVLGHASQTPNNLQVKSEM